MKIAHNEIVKKGRTSRNNLKDAVLIGAILVISLVPRLWQLEKYPPVIVDEPANVRDIILIQKNGFKLTDFHWDNNESRIALLPAYILTRLGMENNILTLRYSSLLLSLITITAFYFLIKMFSGSLTAFITALLFSWSYYFLQFSRVGWTNIAVVAIGICFFLALEKAIQNNKWQLFLIAGLLSGLLPYLYSSSWIYILSGFTYLLFLIIFERKNIPQRITGFVLFTVTFLIAALPWFYKISNNWEDHLVRYNVVSIKKAELPYHGLYEKNQIYFYQIGTTIKSWIFLDAVDGGRHENPRYLPLRYPPVNILVRIGFWAGLVMAFFSFSKTFYWYLVYLFALLFGQILTVDPPNGARGLVMLPFIYLFFSLALNKFLYLQNHKSFKVIISILALLFAYMDFTFYQYWMTWIDVYRI